MLQLNMFGMVLEGEELYNPGDVATWIFIFVANLGGYTFCVVTVEKLYK